MANWYKNLTIFLIFVSFFLLPPMKAKANALTDVVVSVSGNAPITQSTHEISFKLGTTWALKKINIRYHKKDGDLNKPAHLNFLNATADEITGLGETWSIDLSSSSSGLVVLQNSETEPTELASGTAISYSVLSVVNPELGDCLNKTMRDTCSVTIETVDIEDNGIDTGSGTYDIAEDPSMEFIISGVNADTATNGVTTSVTTAYNQIDFGSLKIATPKYGAHKIKVISNTPNGYEVQMRLDGYIEALNPAYKIDPFAATNVTWNDPGSWETPYGTSCDLESCSDVGWIGANTNDTRIGGNWSSASGKFGPVSTTRHLVMKGASRDTGTEAYVTYALEVNEFMPPERYAGTIIYEIWPTY